MPAPYNADLQWRVIWFVHILQNSVAEASFVKEQWNTISKFQVKGHVKPESVGHSYGIISFAQRFCIPNMKTTVIFGRQLPFVVLSDNVF